MTMSEQSYLNIMKRRCIFKILDNILLVLIFHAKSTIFGFYCRFPYSYCLDMGSNSMVSFALLVKLNLSFTVLLFYLLVFWLVFVLVLMKQCVPRHCVHSFKWCLHSIVKVSMYTFCNLHKDIRVFFNGPRDT